MESDHVVEWDTHTEGETHTVIAKTILDTTVEIFEGTAEECEVRLDEIYASRTEEGNALRHVCKELAERDDKLEASIRRLTAI